MIEYTTDTLIQTTLFTEMPLSIEDCKLIKKAIILLENKKDKNNEDTIQVLNKVQDRLKSILNFV